MRIDTNRFGPIEAADDDLVHFSNGLIGFPMEREFLLIPHPKSEFIAWLQSAKTPGLAFPVVSAHSLPIDYPDVPISEVAERHGIGGALEELAILLVLSAPREQPATLNLLAPLVVNANERRGAQVFLDGSRYSTRELFVLPDQKVEKAEPEAQAETASL